MKNLEFVFDNDTYERLDVFLTRVTDGMSRSAVDRLIEAGNVTVNGKLVGKSEKVVFGDTVVMCVPDAKPYEVEAENIDIDVVYEDDDLLVVNKPKGMVVHPAAGNYNGTLVNALLHHCKGSLSGINGVARPGIVHRIDKDTSGLLIVAKNDFAHAGLAEQIKVHSFDREYEAVIVGHLKESSGTVDAPIGRHPIKRKQMAVTEKNSKNAVTHWRVLEEFKGYSHVRLALETGRTHQIRVHMAHLGHPVAGDTLYGGPAQKNFEGQCLHAKMIGFVHPRTNEYLRFESDLPDYFKNFLDSLSE